MSNLHPLIKNRFIDHPFRLEGGAVIKQDVIKDPEMSVAIPSILPVTIDPNDYPEWLHTLSAALALAIIFSKKAEFALMDLEPLVLENAYGPEELPSKESPVIQAIIDAFMVAVDSGRYRIWAQNFAPTFILKSLSTPNITFVPSPMLRKLNVGNFVKQYADCTVLNHVVDWTALYNDKHQIQFSQSPMMMALLHYHETRPELNLYKIITNIGHYPMGMLAGEMTYSDVMTIVNAPNRVRARLFNIANGYAHSCDSSRNPMKLGGMMSDKLGTEFTDLGSRLKRRDANKLDDKFVGDLTNKMLYKSTDLYGSMIKGLRYSEDTSNRMIPAFIRNTHTASTRTDMLEEISQVKYALTEHSRPKNKYVPNYVVTGTYKGKKYTLKLLEPGDIRALYIGQYTDDCMHLGGAGRKAAVSAYTSGYRGVYVLCDSNDDIIVQSYIWVGQASGHLKPAREKYSRLLGSSFKLLNHHKLLGWDDYPIVVFDSIESLRSGDDSIDEDGQMSMISDMFIQLFDVISGQDVWKNHRIYIGDAKIGRITDTTKVLDKNMTLFRSVRYDRHEALCGYRKDTGHPLWEAVGYTDISRSCPKYFNPIHYVGKKYGEFEPIPICKHLFLLKYTALTSHAKISASELATVKWSPNQSQEISIFQSGEIKKIFKEYIRKINRKLMECGCITYACHDILERLKLSTRPRQNKNLVQINKRNSVNKSQVYIGGKKTFEDEFSYRTITATKPDPDNKDTDFTMIWNNVNCDGYFYFKFPKTKRVLVVPERSQRHTWLWDNICRLQLLERELLFTFDDEDKLTKMIINIRDNLVGVGMVDMPSPFISHFIDNVGLIRAPRGFRISVEEMAMPNLDGLRTVLERHRHGRGLGMDFDGDMLHTWTTDVHFGANMQPNISAGMMAVMDDMGYITEDGCIVRGTKATETPKKEIKHVSKFYNNLNSQRTIYGPLFTDMFGSTVALDYLVCVLAETVSDHLRMVSTNEHDIINLVKLHFLKLGTMLNLPEFSNLLNTTQGREQYLDMMVNSLKPKYQYLIYQHPQILFSPPSVYGDQLEMIPKLKDSFTFQDIYGQTIIRNYRLGQVHSHAMVTDFKLSTQRHKETTKVPNMVQLVPKTRAMLLEVIGSFIARCGLVV